MTDISIRIHMFMSNLVSSLKREEGQDLIEYALLGGLIAAGILLAGALAFQGPINAMATGIGECIDFDTTPCSTPFS